MEMRIEKEMRDRVIMVLSFQGVTHCSWREADKTEDDEEREEVRSMRT
jgi:hypothetical protein